MKIIIVTETLHAGGAETFVIRLANGLAAEHDVVLINLYRHLSKPELINQLSKDVNLVNLKFPFRFILSKVDGIFYKFKVDFSFVELHIKSILKKIIEFQKPSVVHSHLFKPDYYVSLIKETSKHKFNHVVTNHGDYLLFDKKDPVRLLNYEKKLNETLSSINSIACISDDQLSWATEKKEKNSYTYGIFKILNGYSIVNTISYKKTELLLDAEDFVFGMVARGIKQKGWENLINAFTKLNLLKAKLVLVGEGPEIEILKKNYKNETKIIFVGYAASPIEYIRRFDVALLPSYYAAESLPTVIIEYLLCNKPIIASDIGAVKQMLQTSTNEIAGLLIKFDLHGVDENDLMNKMKILYADNLLRNDLINLTKQAFLKFDMQRCVDSYLNIYGQNGK